MAKKFYYSSKQSSSTNDTKPTENIQKSSSEGARTDNNQNRNRNRKPSRGRQNNDTAVIAVKYPKEKMSLALENIGVSAPLAEFLAKNRINTAGELVVRTEKDMFKLQGFNKRMLFELKDALKTQDMTFRPESKPQEKPTVRKDDDRTNARNRDKNSGGADKEVKRPQKEQREKPVKLTEPLPVEEWRKIQIGGKWGFHDGFKTVVPTMYDEVFCFRDGLASVELDEKCGYIDCDNNIIIPMDYETAMSFSEGLAAVVKGGKYGYIDKENTIQIPFVYDAATRFEGGEAKVKKDGKWGTISPDGTVKWI